MHICVGFSLCEGSGVIQDQGGFFRLLLRRLRCMLNNGNIVCWTMLNWFVEKHCWNNVEDWHQRRTSFPCFFTALQVLIQIVLIMQSDDRNSHDLVDTNKVVVCKKNVACNHITSGFAVSHAPVMSFSQSLIFFILICFKRCDQMFVWKAGHQRKSVHH